MRPPRDVYSQTYREARERFIAAADAADLDVQSHVHPMLGRDGETLAMDVVRDGPPDAASALVISSACHGVEGYCGSAVQTALLHDDAWRRTAQAAHVAVLYIHALNPYGFSWWRRTTHENVDLNRNFLDFRQPLPANDGYDAIAALVVPAVWPPSAEVEAHWQRCIDERGMEAIQRAVSGGQYTHPEGIFYGGRNPTWSHVTLRHVLRDHGQRCRQLGWIDLHTGLGPTGIGERIHAGRDDAAELRRARAWWGDSVTSIYSGTSSSARLDGLMWNAAYEECPQALYTGIALEYGTVPLMEMFDALRADQWLELHPEADPAQQRQIKQQVRDAFYVDTDAWKQQILEQAFDVAHQAVRGLAAGVRSMTAETPSASVQAVRPDREVLTRQRLPYFVGIAGSTVGATGLSMHMVVIPPGARAEPHAHRGYETGIYVLEGRVETRYGPALETSVISEAGDFLFIPPDVPHEAINLSATEPARAIVARNDPAEQDNVVPYQPGA